MVQTRQSTARALAERVTQKPCKLKQIRGRCCIFVAGAPSTDYFGLTWDEALDKLVIKFGHPELVSTASSHLRPDLPVK